MTHDQVEAMTLADKIVVLRDGVVEQVGTPLDLYDDPNNLFVAGFIGSPKMNFLKGVIEGGAVRLSEYDTIIPTSVKAANGTAVTVGIRPDSFKAGGTATLEVGVEIIEHLGGETYAYARRGIGDVLTIATGNDRNLQSGDAYKAHFDPAAALIFGADGLRIR